MIMIRNLTAALGVAVLGCAGRATTNPAPEPRPEPLPGAQQPVLVPSPTPPRIIPNVRLAGDTNAVPAFADTALIAWGPEPAGTVHVLPPHEYDLQHQSVRIRFDWSRHAVVGSTTLRIAALDHAISDVPLNAVGMTVRRVATVASTPLRFDYDGQMLTVHFARPLPARARTSIVIDYETVQPRKGAYFIDRNHYLWTQGEAQDNRYWIPTYDHPDDKTTWDMSIVTDTGEKALSNGRLMGTRPVKGGVLWHWAQQQHASTYLMSIVTGRYTVVKDHWHNVPVEYWTYPDSVEAARRGFGRTPDAMEVFSRKTGIPYPWAKYAQSVVPDFIFGGMENVSATTQNDDGILHPAWAEPQFNADGLMSHELGHQWFGDLLTTRDWSHAWLNEGFATFMEQTYREASRGADEGMWDRMDAQQQTIAADRRNRRPIVYNRYVDDPLEIFFSGHIYPKGATVLQMLRHQLGDSLFWASMHHYAASHLHGNVVTDDLRRAFEESTRRDFGAFFKQWVYGAGFPVFRVSSSYDSTSRRLALHADEIQSRDSLTGYFDVDVDVEVLTDAGPARGVMAVRNGRGDVTLTLGSAPRAIEWNKGAWVLALSDFPRSTAMLNYQLAHGDDVASRDEAVTLLAGRGGDAAAARALATAAASDRFWALRAHALRALTAFDHDSVARVTILAAVRDSDSRIRQTAVTALASFPGTGTDSLLITAARSDASPIVRGAALASYIRAAGDGALPLAREMMAESSWRGVLRTPALAVLKGMQSEAARELYQRYAK
jgi:aminopeptidase N